MFWTSPVGREPRFRVSFRFGAHISIWAHYLNMSGSFYCKVYILHFFYWWLIVQINQSFCFCASYLEFSKLGFISKRELLFIFGSRYFWWRTQGYKKKARQLHTRYKRCSNERVPLFQPGTTHCYKLLWQIAICDDEMKAVLKESSPARLLWQQQKESMKKGKGMRWHPAIIRFCIALHSKSKAAYDLIRQSGFSCLPHPTTIHPYSHFGSITTGVNADLVKRISSDFISRGMPDHHRDITLLYDEMKVKSGLVFSESLGSIVGFVDVGSIGNEILAFERKCRKEEDAPIATHVLVCMARGVFTSLHAP